jgi:peptidoglycan/xylan/chitin deacetylase (PgdA/CDA1 family)
MRAVLSRVRQLPAVDRRLATLAPRLAGVRSGLDPASHAVALTFDDGPDPAHTPALLDRLAELGVVATFFGVGAHARAHPELVRRAADAGHAIGSHSWSHPEPWTVDLATLRREYRDGRHALEDVLGRDVALFRPPYGYVSVKGAYAMRAARLRPWLWTIDPRDWEPGVTTDALRERLGTLEAGAVVLLHDSLVGARSHDVVDRSPTIGALESTVASARERGLRFTTLPS